MTTKLDHRVQEHLRHVRQLVRQLDVEPPEDGGEPSWIAFARDVLDERHGIEIDSRDPNAPELDDETLALLVEADELLSTQLFRLLMLNEHRQKRLAAVPADERADFWWYSRGASLPAEAVRHLSDVAALIAAFPEARREFDALSRAEELLISTPARARVSAPSWGKHAPLWPGSVEAEAVSSSSSSFPGSFSGSRSDAPRSARWRAWTVVASAALVLLGVGGGLAFHSAQQRAEAEKAALQAQIADAEKAALDQVARLKSQTEDAGTMSQAQQDRLEAQIAVAEKKAQEAASASEAARASPASAGGAARPVRVRSGSASSSSSNCAPGDPMCGGM